MTTACIVTRLRAGARGVRSAPARRARRTIRRGRCASSSAFRRAPPAIWSRARLAAHLGNALGQQFVVENRPGASSNIATEYAARAPKDGYTLFLGTVANVVNAAVSSNLSFDFAKDFAPIALVGDRAGGAGGASSTGVEQRAGADRAGQGEARPVELCLVRRRHHAASGRRAAQRARRHQARACALPGQLAGGDRSAGRPHPDHVLGGLGGAAAHQGRHAQGAGLGRAEARRACCRTCRRWPRSACPSSTPASGSA